MSEELTIDTFEKYLFESKLPVIVDFYAKWCSPCKMMTPIFDKLSEDYQNRLNFVKFDTEKSIEISKQNSISSIPCFIIYYKKEEIGRIIGYKEEDILRIEINKILDSVHM